MATVWGDRRCCLINPVRRTAHCIQHSRFGPLLCTAMSDESASASASDGSIRATRVVPEATRRKVEIASAGDTNAPMAPGASRDNGPNRNVKA